MFSKYQIYSSIQTVSSTSADQAIVFKLLLYLDKAQLINSIYSFSIFINLLHIVVLQQALIADVLLARIENGTCAIYHYNSKK